MSATLCFNQHRWRWMICCHGRVMCCASLCLHFDVRVLNMDAPSCNSVPHTHMWWHVCSGPCECHWCNTRWHITVQTKKTRRRISRKQWRKLNKGNVWCECGYEQCKENLYTFLHQCCQHFSHNFSVMRPNSTPDRKTYKNITTKTSPHKHHHTTTPHHHKNTTTPPQKPQKHHHKNTTTPILPQFSTVVRFSPVKNVLFTSLFHRSPV